MAIIETSLLGSSASAMDCEVYRTISKRLSRILRYEINPRGLFTDSASFVLFDDLIRHLDYYDPDDVYQVATESSHREHGPRFELLDDNARGLLIRAAPSGNQAALVANRTGPPCQRLRQCSLIARSVEPLLKQCPWAQLLSPPVQHLLIQTLP